MVDEVKRVTPFLRVTESLAHDGEGKRLRHLGWATPSVSRALNWIRETIAKEMGEDI